MDIVGPLPTSYTGNKYILTYQDYLTRYVEAIPLPDQKAETVAKAFVTEIICRHGAPKQLLTDLGSNFVSKLMMEVYKLLKIQKLQTTPYHPQANGMIERTHRVLKEILSHFVEKDQKEWDRFLPYVVMAYRNMTHSATGETPFYLLHGRDFAFPFDDIINPRRIKYDIAENYGSELMQRLHIVYQEVRDKLRKAAERQEKYQKKSRIKDIQIGDLVFIRDLATQIGIAKKLTRKWKGPYRVLEKNSPVNFTVKAPGKHKSIRVHSNLLKKYRVHQPDLLTQEEQEEEVAGEETAKSRFDDGEEEAASSEDDDASGSTSKPRHGALIMIAPDPQETLVENPLPIQRRPRSPPMQREVNQYELPPPPDWVQLRREQQPQGQPEIDETVEETIEQEETADAEPVAPPEDAPPARSTRSRGPAPSTPWIYKGRI